jgi:hypothetical protein
MSFYFKDFIPFSGLVRFFASSPRQVQAGLKETVVWGWRKGLVLQILSPIFWIKIYHRTVGSIMSDAWCIILHFKILWPPL